MAQNKRRSRNTFPKFEHQMTRLILGLLVVFLLMLAASALGIGWMKWLLAVPELLACAAGCGLLVLKQEHRRKRSHWMLASFASLFACTLASLLLGFPAPGV